ncbi:MAG: hypothetical protein LBU79_10270 [Planctomycetota bacterium]|nr:hypothetical protein [Planctomycetota bacterium]
MSIGRTILAILFIILLAALGYVLSENIEKVFGPSGPPPPPPEQDLLPDDFDSDSETEGIGGGAAGGTRGGTPSLTDDSITSLAGQAERLLGRDDSLALDLLGRAISLDPTYMRLWRLKAIAHINREENPKAAAAIEVLRLANPGDPVTILLMVENISRWPGLGQGEINRQLTEIFADRDMEAAGNLVASILEQAGAIEWLAWFLPVWQNMGPGLGQAAQILRFLSLNQPTQALEALEQPASEYLTPRLRAVVQDIVLRANQDTGHGLWQPEQGDIRREKEGMVQKSLPGENALAAFGIRPGWRNLRISFQTTGNANAAQSVYVRYSSPMSFLRLSFTNQETLVLQERIPERGLYTIFESPADFVLGKRLVLTLRGDRLSLSAGGENLLPEPNLPISPQIQPGKIALGLENTSQLEQSVTYPMLLVEIAEPRWLIRPESGGDNYLSTALTNWENSVLVLDPDQADTLTALLQATNAGVKNFALLPPGSLDLSRVEAKTSRLPAPLGTNIWTGVVFEPGANPDWQGLASAMEQAKGKGKETALRLKNDPTGRPILPEDIPFLDWLLLPPSPVALPATVHSGTYGQVLVGQNSRPEVFILAK